MGTLDEEKPKAKRHRRLRKKQVRKMREAMAREENPMTVDEAAEEWGIPYFTAYQIRRGWSYKDAGGPIQPKAERKGKMPPELAERLRKLAKKGATVDQLVAASKYGHTAVKKALAGER